MCKIAFFFFSQNPVSTGSSLKSNLDLTQNVVVARVQICTSNFLFPVVGSYWLSVIRCTVDWLSPRGVPEETQVLVRTLG